MELVDKVTDIVSDALKAAGKFAENTVNEYVEPLVIAAQNIYNVCLKSGMTPEEAADKTEAVIREVTGQVII